MNAHAGLVAVIPTRNRAELAIRALHSLLTQSGNHDLVVLVSDNSSDRSDSQKLSSFCTQLADTRVAYVVPPQDMSMTLHWDWAMKFALSHYSQSHFFFLTDRMILRKEALAELVSSIKRHPDEVISYNHDRINDIKKPVTLELSPWSGNLVRIRSTTLLSLSSQMVFHPSLPRMLNCAVPRLLIEKIKDRFGSIFSSVSPDFCFCYRLLGTCDYIVYYDKPLLVHYALGRSNGASVSRGIPTSDSKNFKAHLPKSDNIFPFSPLPELLTVGNAIINEYLFVKNEMETNAFPAIDKIRHMRFLSQEICGITDDRMRSEMLSLLHSSGGKTELHVSLVNIQRLFTRILFPGLKFASIENALRFASENYLPGPSPRKYTSAFLFACPDKARFQKYLKIFHHVVLRQRSVAILKKTRAGAGPPKYAPYK